jgi:hypothetical protein
MRSRQPQAITEHFPNCSANDRSTPVNGRTQPRTGLFASGPITVIAAAQASWVNSRAWRRPLLIAHLFAWELSPKQLCEAASIHRQEESVEIQPWR